MKDDYKTSLTKEDFVKVFNEVTLTKGELKLLEVLYHAKNHTATGLELQEILNKNHVGGINLTFSRISKKIAEFTGIYPVKREDGAFRWWSLLAIGEEVGKLYSWELRPEIVEAIEETRVLKSNSLTMKSETNRLARICWNEHYWEKPSGKIGKSKNNNAYENFAGFGWEEWLFDTKKIIEGYHYGFIQAVNRNWKKYQNQTMDISLFTINGNTKEKWWIGKIKNVEIITTDKSDEIYQIYEQKGWAEEMRSQLKEVGGDLSQFVHGHIDYFFNLRYKPENLELLEEPLKIAAGDKTIKAFYSSTLFYFERLPRLEQNIDKNLDFKAGHNERKETTNSSYQRNVKDISLFHNKMQNSIYNQLTEKYGAENVATEQNTGLGSKVDIVVRIGNETYNFYELKTYNSITKCVREALSQLMEYAFYPKHERANSLIIVSQNPVDTDMKNYLKVLRLKFNLPVWYQQYDIEQGKLKDEKY